MYKRFLFLTVFVIWIAGCSSSNEIGNNDIEDYDVENTVDMVEDGDFTFRLVSEKEEYQVGEDIKLYGEITYQGEKEAVTMNHAASAILFPMKEKVRGYDIGFAVSEIGVSTVLKRGEAYKEVYGKNVWHEEGSPDEYIAFIEDFLNRDGFPIGYYVVSGETNFYVEGQGTIQMEAMVDFKVVE